MRHLSLFTYSLQPWNLESKIPKVQNIPVDTEITLERRDEAETEIRDKQKLVDYDTREYPVELLVQKYTDGHLD